MQADGTVVIDTKINTAGTETGTEDIKKTVKSTVDYMKMLPQSFKDLPKIVQYAFSSASK